MVIIDKEPQLNNWTSQLPLYEALDWELMCTMVFCVYLYVIVPFNWKVQVVQRGREISNPMRNGHKKGLKNNSN